MNTTGLMEGAQCKLSSSSRIESFKTSLESFMEFLCRNHIRNVSYVMMEIMPMLVARCEDGLTNWKQEWGMEQLKIMNIEWLAWLAIESAWTLQLMITTASLFCQIRHVFSENLLKSEDNSNKMGINTV